MIPQPVPYGVLILSLDITARKLSEQKLQEESIRVAVAQGRAQEAEQINNLVIGRELKMVELKDKIAQLEKKVEELEKKQLGKTQ